MSIKAYMDDINLHFKEITEDAMQVVPDLVDDPNTFPPEFWTLWKQSSLIALGEMQTRVHWNDMEETDRGWDRKRVETKTRGSLSGS